MKTHITRREAARLLAATSLGAFATSKLRASATQATDVVRARIHDAIARGKATGAAVAIVEGGRIAWEEGFGWANREAKVKATPHTSFGMASLTKPFTATTLMTLAHEGRLSLDAPANNYLPVKISGANGDPSAATVRTIGAHNSGLPGMYESYDESEFKLIPAPGELLRTYGRLAYPPGLTYEYSNIGYTALNAIALALTHTELGALMHARVLAPLGLADTFFSSDMARVPTGATRYNPLDQPIPRYKTSTPASGELYSSAHDLANFLLWNLHGDDASRTSILSTHDRAELHRPVFTGPSGIASTFGWFHGQTPSGVPFWFKGGGDPGVANRMYFVPSRGLGCVVLTNRSDGTELAHAVCDDILRAHLPDWQRPDEYCGFQPSPLAAPQPFAGRWHGTLANDGVNLPVSLSVTSATDATFTLGNNAPQPLTNIQAEGDALTATAQGNIDSIDSPDTQRTHATALLLKLIPRDGRLVGRVYASAGDANFRNARLPYVLNLARQGSAVRQ